MEYAGGGAGALQCEPRPAGAHPGSAGANAGFPGTGPRHQPRRASTSAPRGPSPLSAHSSASSRNTTPASYPISTRASSRRACSYRTITAGSRSSRSGFPAPSSPWTPRRRSLLSSGGVKVLGSILRNSHKDLVKASLEGMLRKAISSHVLPLLGLHNLQDRYHIMHKSFMQRFTHLFRQTSHRNSRTLWETPSCPFSTTALAGAAPSS
jgi:hypothetical protein